MAKKDYSKVIKKWILYACIAIVVAWAGSIPLKYYRIYSANKKYLADFVKVKDYNFNIYKTNAAINVAIENYGNRLLDSIVLKIEYYDSKDNMLAMDYANVLKMSKDVLYPKAGKVFRISVTCPENTSKIKLKIN
ncbi:MAG: hypothetical protein PHI86_03855 [Candidatus Omnitrophica bacterium]|nr:hypothetical protein [Candidatus Omnitrophota bacterium]HOX55200.1 hypothetical protein [Candidatus Omnitrophota bacterium]